MADSPRDADEKTGYSAALIIQGTAGDTGAKSVKYGVESRKDIWDVGRRLKKGAVCTIEATGPARTAIRIANAVYHNKRNINGGRYLAFIKNGVRFWVFLYDIRFISINGNKL